MFVSLITPYLLLSLTLSPDLKVYADKIKQGAESPIEGALLSKSSWLLLRSYFGAGERCRFIADASAASCKEQIDLILATCNDRQGPPEEDLLLQALNVELTQAKEELQASRAKNTRWRWLAVGASSLALSVSVAAWVYSKGR